MEAQLSTPAVLEFNKVKKELMRTLLEEVEELLARLRRVLEEVP